MRVLTIVNPGSGAVDEPALVTHTIRHHPGVGRLEGLEIRMTAEGGDAARFAREAVDDGFDRILVGGGDGTVGDVVNGVLGAGAEAGAVELGILPLGTGNDFARACELPLDLPEALEVALEGTPRPMDVVRVRGPVDRWFINASTGGFGGRVDRELTDEIKGAWGALAYARAAVSILAEPETYELVLELDEGEETLQCEALNLVVANGRSVGGGIRVAPDAHLDDGRVDVVVVRAESPARLAALGPPMVFGAHLDHELVIHRRARSVSVRSDPPMPFNCDGEPVGETPVSFEVAPGGLLLVTPDPAPDAFSRG